MKIGDRDAAMGFYEGEDSTARDLVRQLSMQSYSGGMRVLLLGDVEFATPTAANALLKFLEEPPRGVVMHAHDGGARRACCRRFASRVVEVRFPPLSTARKCRNPRADARTPPPTRSSRASLGGGSVTRAVAALERRRGIAARARRRVVLRERCGGKRPRARGRAARRSTRA